MFETIHCRLHPIYPPHSRLSGHGKTPAAPGLSFHFTHLCPPSTQHTRMHTESCPSSCAALRSSDYVNAVAFSPSGDKLMSVSWDKNVKLWDLRMNRERRTMKGHPAYLWAGAWSPDGLRLLVAGDSKKLVLHTV